MPATIVETRLGETPWLVARGRRAEVFFELGRSASQQIREVIAGAPELDPLRRRVTTPGGAAHFAAVAQTSREAHPDAWLELEALAAGADVAHTDLLLLTLRGDVGTIEDGCSDVGVADGGHLLLGHNEDGDRSLHGRCRLLTLQLDGEPAVTSYWYPGFLPGNTFTVTEHGMAWGIDAIHVPNPPDAPGRAFVARGVQRMPGIDAATAWLRRQPSAGGFAYVLASRSERRIVVVEHVAGQTATLGTDPGQPAVWHTNHLRALDAVADRPSPNSLARGELLEVALPPESPSAPWLLELLATPQPDGVRAGAGAGSSVTLCTFVADLVADELTLLPLDGTTVTIPLADFASGVATRARGGDIAGTRRARVGP